MGEVVGVNVAIRAGAQNIGFALPIDFVIGRAADLVARRRPRPSTFVVKDSVIRDAVESQARRAAPGRGGRVQLARRRRRRSSRAMSSNRSTT